MRSHVLVHRRPDVSLKSRLASLRVASAKKLRLEEKRVTFVRAQVVFASVVMMTPQKPWVTEGEIRARRSRNLMEDNPASG